MAKKTNPYLYTHEAKGQTRYGYRREYKGKQLRARGFATSSEAEQHLNQAIADVDAVIRGEVSEIAQVHVAVAVGVAEGPGPVRQLVAGREIAQVAEVHVAVQVGVGAVF